MPHFAKTDFKAVFSEFFTLDDTFIVFDIKIARRGPKIEI